MIKINLVKKEVLLHREVSQSDSLEKINFSFLSHPILKNWIYSLILGYAAFYGLEQYKEIKISELNQILNEKKDQMSKIQRKMDSTKEFDAVKNTMDNDEKSIRIKLETIKNLIAKKNIVLHSMLSLSSSIPSNVWLSMITLKEDNFIIQGESVDFKFIAEFIRKIKEDTFFSSLELVEAQKKAQNIHFVMVSVKK